MTNSAVVGTLRTMLTMDTASYEAGGKKAVSVNAAVNKSIADTGKEIAKITPQAERMVKALGGDKLLYTANSLTQAITKLGGATKLNEAEQARANKTLSDAIAKYTLLGQKAPQAMIDLEKETRKSTTTTEHLTKAISGDLQGAFAALGPTIAATFSIGAVVSFARSVGAFAGQMNDLSAQTGIGVERLQALNYVGAGVGVTVDDLATAVGQLSKRLGGDDKSAAAALDRLGLSADNLKAAAPDEVLFAIAKAFKDITNQNERTALAMELFGKSGARMLRMFDGDLQQTVAQVENSGAVISRELIQKADDFDDAWSQALIRFKANAVNAFGWLSAEGGANAAEARGKRFLELVERLQKQVNIAQPPALVVPSASDSDIKAIEAQSQKLLAAAEAYRQAVAHIFADISGAAAVEQVRQLAAAWGQLTPQQQANSKIVAEVLKRYEELRAKVGDDVAPALEHLFTVTGTLTNKTHELKDAIGALPPVIEAAADSIEGHLIPSAQGFDQLFESAKRIKEAREELERLGMIAPQITEENEHVSDSVERQTRSWGGLAAAVKSSLGQFSDATIGKLGSLLFGFGKDTRDLKATAETAHQEYLRIQRSGKATAEELTLAFKRWHEAEDRANHGFAERFTDVWQGIKHSFENVLNDMLKYFVEGFLKKMIIAALGAKLAEKLFGKPGGGGDNGDRPGIPGDLPWKNILKDLGKAGKWLVTNPIGWAILAGSALGLGIWKKGWLRGGEEALKVNGPRDQFVAQFGGDPANKGVGGAGWNLAAKLTSLGFGDGGGALMLALSRASTEKSFHTAEDNIIAGFAQHGVRGIQKFNHGGFVPPGAVVPAILHGGGMGEAIVPLSAIAQQHEDSYKGPRNIHYHEWKIQAWDGRDVHRVVREEIVPQLKMMMTNDTDGLSTAVNRATRSHDRQGYR